MTVLSRHFLLLLVLPMIALFSVCYLATPTGNAQSLTESIPSIKTTYSDVTSQHWAFRHIVKLSALGIVKGDVNGQLLPNNNVTQQEAAVIAIRLLGLEDEALADKRTVVLGFDVDAYYRPYVVKALESKILNLAEETTAASSGNVRLPWGKRAATREWVSKLVVRTIKQTPSNGSTAKFGFNDASKVSAMAAPFVSKAVELGLVTGFIDNTFRPAEAVTRAQIVTFFSRALPYMPSNLNHIVSGYIINQSSDQLVLQLEGGNTQSFKLMKDTATFNITGKQVSNSSLDSLQEIEIIHDNGQALYIEVSDRKVEPETIIGKIIAFALPSMTISLLKSDGTTANYTLAPNIAVTSVSGQELPLTQLTISSNVRLLRFPRNPQVTGMQILNLAFNALGSGTIQAVNSTGRSLTYTSNDGVSRTYDIATEATIKILDKIAPTLTSLNNGDVFQFEIKDSKFVMIQVTSPKMVMTNGELIKITTDTINVVEPSGVLKAYFLSPQLVVAIKGLTNPTIEDLRKGERIQLHLNSATNRVEQITVLDRVITTIRYATIRDFDMEYGYITIINENNEPTLYRITDKTKFMLDDVKLPSALFGQYLVKQRKVNLLVTNQELVRLDIVSKVNGIIQNIDSLTRTIIVTTGSGASYKLPYSNSTNIEIPFMSNANIADLKIGSRVQVLMNTTLDTILYIGIHQSNVYTLNSIDIAAQTLNVRDGQNTNLFVAWEALTVMKNRDNQIIAPNQFTIGNPIIVSYTGKRLVSVQASSPLRGKVISVDRVAGKFSIMDFMNTTKEFSLKEGYTLQIKNVIDNNLSNIKLNDRVQVVTDGFGRPYIWLAEGAEKSFSSYQAISQDITFKRVLLTDQANFPIHPEAYLHTAQGNLLDLTKLKENDRLTIYVLEGKIIEIIQ
jgi:hypothetical protein